MRLIITLSALALLFASAALAGDDYPTLFPDGVKKHANAFIDNLETDWGDANKDELSGSFLSERVEAWKSFWRTSAINSVPIGVRLYMTDSRGDEREYFYLTGFDKKNKAVWQKGDFPMGKKGPEGFVLDDPDKLDFDKVDARSWCYLPGYNWVMRGNQWPQRLLNFAAYMYQNADKREDWLWVGNYAMTVYLERQQQNTPQHAEALAFLKEQHEFGDAFLKPEGRTTLIFSEGEDEIKETTEAKKSESRTRAFDAWCEAEKKLLQARVDARGEDLGLSWQQLNDELVALELAFKNSNFLKVQAEEFKEYADIDGEKEKRDKAKARKDVEGNFFLLKEDIEMRYAEVTKAIADAETKSTAAEASGDWDEAVEAWQKVYGFGKYKGYVLDPFYFQKMLGCALILQQAAKPDRFYKRVDHEHHAKAAIDMCALILTYRPEDVKAHVIKAIGHIMVQDYNDAEDELDLAESYPHVTEAQKKSIESWRKTMENLLRAR